MADLFTPEASVESLREALDGVEAALDRLDDLGVVESVVHMYAPGVGWFTARDARTQMVRVSAGADLADVLGLQAIPSADDDEATLRAMTSAVCEFVEEALAEPIAPPRPAPRRLAPHERRDGAPTAEIPVVVDPSVSSVVELFRRS